MSQEPQQKWNKDEKGRDEKGHDEKGRDEKGQDEKGRNDALSSVVWAAIFVWAGLVLLASNLNLLGNLTIGETEFAPWSLIFVGAGVIVLVEVVLRLIMPTYRRSVTGSLIFAGILLAIGLGGWIGWNSIWPIFLILIGVSILVGNFTRR
jgi:hypothetical protein